MGTIELHFRGPFSFLNKSNSLFECEYARSKGIYLWTIKSNFGYLIHYIGETGNFAKRHREHLINLLGLNYGIFDVPQAREGRQVVIWRGLWRLKSSFPIEDLLRVYQEKASQVIEYINSLDVFFAELNVDLNIRRHIEGSIGWNLRNNYPDFKVLYPDDNHIGAKPGKMKKKLVITSHEKILGLDPEIEL
ncbi:MAG: hypothetical protein NUV70_09010 [Caldiserica bacterium]|jgi:hypothetical protein|nr:hypothetical protein [Caldisericota bacterium]